MSIIDQSLKINYREQMGQKVVTDQLSAYQPSKEEKEVRQMIINHFTLGSTTMFTPRVEFSDLSVIYRDQVDQMAFNTYQPNNGDAPEGDEIAGWRSRAMRPIVRNKCVSIAAHATARLIFPKIFAQNNQSEDQQASAQVMSDLIEYTAEKSNYPMTALYATIQAEVSPVSIVHTEYNEVYRTVKREKNADGTWKTERILDETMSGFIDTIVPTDQLYIENFYEPDIQKQQWVIWRRVQSHQLLKQKYADCPNFKYVIPGYQILYNDANQAFYNVYDPNMRPYMNEEVIYWNKQLDLMIPMVNGILMKPHDNPNPRWDKLLPFIAFGYEIINSKCFYYKSLVFKMQQDANIINTLYPMFIDGTYLNMMPPMINRGGEVIGSDVIVPGAVTNLSDKDAHLDPVKIASDLTSGLEALNKVEESINQTSVQPVASPDMKQETAYEISKQEQERNTQLGLFLQMIAHFVKQYGKLRIGDILQYLTVAEVNQITDNPELVYKAFVLRDKKTEAGKKTRRIVFDSKMPDGPMTEEEELKLSYETMKMQGGSKSDVELYRVHPELFRNLKYETVVSPDVMNPLSEEVERAFGLEAYDRAIANPSADPEELLKSLVLGQNPATKKNPDRYIKKAPEQSPFMGSPDQIGSPFDLLNATGGKVGQQPMPTNPMAAKPALAR